MTRETKQAIRNSLLTTILAIISVAMIWLYDCIFGTGQFYWLYATPVIPFAVMIHYARKED